MTTVVKAMVVGDRANEKISGRPFDETKGPSQTELRLLKWMEPYDPDRLYNLFLLDNTLREGFDDDRACGAMRVKLRAVREHVTHVLILGTASRDVMGLQADLPFSWSVKKLVGLDVAMAWMWHPSGLCRAYNNPDTVKKAKTLLQGLARAAQDSR